MYDIFINKLIDWCEEYNISNDIVFKLVDGEYIYYEFDGKLTKCLALTYYKKTENIRWNYIEILNRMTNEFLATSVLWHEFCHCEPWIEDGISEGHGDKWLRRLWRKPLYAIGQWLAKIVYRG